MNFLKLLYGNGTLPTMLQQGKTEEEIIATWQPGLDNYLKYFKYSTELKFSYGLLDMVKQDGTEYTRAYRRLGSKMVTLVLCFE